ncbi:YcfA-like protein [Candidatus Methylomirabilis lanthanidiphila]|uniref:YcfA-like protein n=1 Tax=Candidatus Methylomirabilis lanthanidiphila TaxID=2211376 RepID=A0A564ZHB8_9BACT|nr:type II toxin-antitoxin system HicA family toxin [Candidatus Methylomirabilis lanthanidiphila]VUZ84307.1 YcfA-like protein [Candidatus Methylomirabilis lanthanidiphila]
MKLPRDIGGKELAKVLGKYGYRITHQTGSHVRLTSSFKGTEHHVTVPSHRALRAGTLSGILNDIATYLEVEKQSLVEDLFG